MEQLKELAKAYADYEPYKAVHGMSRSLSGLEKLKYERDCGILLEVQIEVYRENV